MNTEIKKIQEEAQRAANEHGIYEAVQIIASNGNNNQDYCKAEWEGCSIIFRMNEGGFANKNSPFKKPTVTSIVMPDNTILYRSLGDNETVTDFRYGKWVERFKTFSNQIILEKKRSEEDSHEKKIIEDLKPFSLIDF